MKKNDVLKGTCVDYTYEGLGIVKVNDFVFFMSHVLIGEEVEFIVTKVQKNYAYGKVKRIISASKNRQTPPCVHYQKCGGCQIMHMNRNEQLQFKTNIVANNMKKIADLQVTVKPTIGGQQEYAYRNKAQFPIAIKHGVEMGFYRLHSNDIIDMNECLIQSRLINDIMVYTKKIFTQLEMEEVFRHLLIKHAFVTNEIMIVFIAKTKKIANFEKTVEMLSAKFSEIKSIILNVNTRMDNVILGDKEYLYYGNDKIKEQLDGLQFSISSRSFYQVNPEQTKVLYEQAVTLANITKEDTVIDLYCGVGTISLFLARQAKQVIGIEIVEAAIEDAKQNAKINQINNVDFVCSDAGSYASEFVKQNNQVDVVVVDPPRKGCDELTISSIVKMQPKRIVYVSCNPSTLARDLKRFKGYGFQTSIVQPVDMFPNSYHVETVVLLTHKKNVKSLCFDMLPI